jgi:hypothetical protein
MEIRIRCRACGASVNESARFCANCGAHLPEVQAAPLVSGEERRWRSRSPLLVLLLIVVIAMGVIVVWLVWS